MVENITAGPVGVVFSPNGYDGLPFKFSHNYKETGHSWDKISGRFAWSLERVDAVL